VHTAIIFNLIRAKILPLVFVIPDMQNSHFTALSISVKFLSERKSTGEKPETGA
jgi:hypothetical protein